MPKILIIESCVVNFRDDKGGQHAAAGSQISLPKAAAEQLVTLGRALFVDKKDDFDKTGVNTATADMLKAAGALKVEAPTAADA